MAASELFIRTGLHAGFRTPNQTEGGGISPKIVPHGSCQPVLRTGPSAMSGNGLPCPNDTMPAGEVFWNAECVVSTMKVIRSDSVRS